MSKELKSKSLMVRMTEAEYQSLKNQAEARETTMSAVIRQNISWGDGQFKADFAKEIAKEIDVEQKLQKIVKEQDKVAKAFMKCYDPKTNYFDYKKGAEIAKWITDNQFLD